MANRVFCLYGSGRFRKRVGLIRWVSGALLASESWAKRSSLCPENPGVCRDCVPAVLPGGGNTGRPRCKSDEGSASFLVLHDCMAVRAPLLDTGEVPSIWSETIPGSSQRPCRFITGTFIGGADRGCADASKGRKVALFFFFPFPFFTFPAMHVLYSKYVFLERPQGFLSLQLGAAWYKGVIGSQTLRLVIAHGARTHSSGATVVMMCDWRLGPRSKQHVFSMHAACEQ